MKNEMRERDEELRMQFVRISSIGTLHMSSTD